jgi:hypothetical protein
VPAGISCGPCLMMRFEHAVLVRMVWGDATKAVK